METKKEVKTPKFGTFSGVFLPSVLAILGAVMYYIAPKVIGGVGLGRGILIILIAHSITIATAYSIASIATNINVKGGGLYFLLSRSLGTEFGGSIGIQLFLAQSVAMSFYSIAFARALQSILVPLGITIPEQLIALGAALLFGMVVWRGAQFVIKLQYVIFGVIILSLVSIFLGGGGHEVHFETFELPFWVAFTMFFPAVTGIDAGVGMSGNLKNPRFSLVKGTFFAIFFTLAIYILLAWKVASSASIGELIGNPTIIHSIAMFPWLVILGVLLATSSSALSCLMTAPRSLQAMTKDKIFSSHFDFLGKGIGNSSEPRFALILSMVIGLWLIVAGGLDFVAQVVGIFFLNVYGWVNGAAFFERFSRNPSFRPTFRSPWIVNLYGMLASYIVMFMFNPIIMVASILFQLTIFLLLVKTCRSSKIEGVWEGLLFEFLRRIMKRIKYHHQDMKNWRPTMVAFYAHKSKSRCIAKILGWIDTNASISKMYLLIPGILRRDSKKRHAIEEHLEDMFKKEDSDIFPKVLVSNHFRISMKTIMQTETIGGLPMNTMLVDFDERFYIPRILRDAAFLKKNVVILRNDCDFGKFDRIDVWWNSEEHGNLMILLAYLISHSKEWDNSSIRILNMVSRESEVIREEEKLNHLVAESRIENVEVTVVVGKDLAAMIKSESGDADLIIMGLPKGGKKVPSEITQRIIHYTDGLPNSLVVLTNDKIDFRFI